MFARQRRTKRTWCDVRDPEAPVPVTDDGLQKAAEAVTRSGMALFDTRELYDCVRDVSERVLACPSPYVDGVVASICAMARDVCSKPVAIVGHRELPSLLPRLEANGILLGTCDFGRRAELVDDLDAAAAGWAERAITGVILVVVGSRDIRRPERVRVVIRLTNEPTMFPACPVTYSPPCLWRITKDNLVHRGPRDRVVAALRTAWAGRAWDPEDKVPGAGRPIECPICMEPRANVVMACCTAAYCWGCMEPWIAQNTYYMDPTQDRISCPSCRKVADYRTFHVVEPDREVVMID